MSDGELIFPSVDAAAAAIAAAPSDFGTGGEDCCPACGLDPCGCGLEVIPIDGFVPIFDAPPAPEPEPGMAAAGRAPPSERLAAWATPAIAAFIDRRAALQAKHGDKAVTDPGRPPALMAHDLKERGAALVDRLTGRAHVLGSAEAREQIEIALATAATAGALALALYERLCADLAEQEAEAA